MGADGDRWEPLEALGGSGRLWEALGLLGGSGSRWDALGGSGRLWEPMGSDPMGADGSRSKLFREMLGMGLQSDSGPTSLVGVGEEVPNRWEEPE